MARIANLALGLLLVRPPLASGASFNCERASLAVEKMICADPSLGQLDQQLAETYRKALAAATDPPALRAQQQKWLSNTRNRCGDRTCLTQAYARRIRELKPAGGAPVPTGSQPTLTPRMLYERLNLRSFPNSYGDRLKFYCESYLQDYFPSDHIRESKDTLDLMDGDDHWMIRISGSDQIEVLNEITSGTYKTMTHYRLRYDRKAGDWRAEGAFVNPVRPDCLPFGPAP